jgi:hypothetical protein
MLNKTDNVSSVKFSVIILSSCSIYFFAHFNTSHYWKLYYIILTVIYWNYHDREMFSCVMKHTLAKANLQERCARSRSFRPCHSTGTWNSRRSPIVTSGFDRRSIPCGFESESGYETEFFLRVLRFLLCQHYSTNVPQSNFLRFPSALYDLSCFSVGKARTFHSVVGVPSLCTRQDSSL